MIATHFDALIDAVGRTVADADRVAAWGSHLADVLAGEPADDPVDQRLAGNRHGRLRAELGERKKPCTLSAAEHERQDFVVQRHRIAANGTPLCRGDVTSV